ncbi:nucleophile aminohydrolase [Mycena filopes]|nr:nucleophile aminohydrolase [Mycena filopes]
MCRLTAVSRPPNAEVSRVLNASLAQIKHRGPDDTGIWVSPDSSVGLGHVRLSIIDLEHGKQPLSDEDDGIHCIVSGEIYDYERIRGELVTQGSTFKTKSDSELVVQLYKHHGLDLLSSLRGEFAFVLYDSSRHLMFAGRDRLGIKPLYYTVLDGNLLIASELKTFLPFGWKAEWDLDSVIHNGDFSIHRTVFKGVNKVTDVSLIFFAAAADLRLSSWGDTPSSFALPATSMFSPTGTSLTLPQTHPTQQQSRR